MRFEEQLLMDLKAEIGARTERRRRVTRRLLAGGAVAGLAAAAAIAVPLLGAETPAYAVTKQDDGTIRVEIKEFGDAGKLEQDLKAAGVTADVTYLKPRTTCAPGRGEPVGGEATTPEEWRQSVSYKAARPRTSGVDISPRYVGAGQTLVLEFAEKPYWKLKAQVITGQVKPCAVIDDPDGSSAGQPPMGD
ncbi:hypothetical protein AB0L65_44750 [Nonomuraea sp. NPDC052116]|uniref:hypothetical protein n=1 Tax=Nonomuraea sp. NPDC052116 TaxID=3155665 RepID=UPI00341BC7A0